MFSCVLIFSVTPDVWVVPGIYRDKKDTVSDLLAYNCSILYFQGLNVCWTGAPGYAIPRGKKG